MYSDNSWFLAGQDSLAVKVKIIPEKYKLNSLSSGGVQDGEFMHACVGDIGPTSNLSWEISLMRPLRVHKDFLFVIFYIHRYMYIR